LAGGNVHLSAAVGRVLHVVATLRQGGAERALCHIIRRDYSHCHIVIKLFTGPGLFDDEVARVSSGVHCVGLPRSWLAFVLLPVAFCRLLWLLLVIRPTVIVGWLYYGALMASIGRLLRLPVLWSLHAADFSLDTSFNAATRSAVRLCRLLSRYVPTFIHYCSEASRIHHERLGFAVGRSRVIVNGIDIDQLGGVEEHDRTALNGEEEIPTSTDTKLIGCVARLEPQKDHRTLLEAMLRLKLVGKQFRLILAGQNCNRDNPRLRKLLDEFGLHREVISLGVIPEVMRLMRHCDAIVLSSCEGEALPMVLLEALSVGKPVVATNIGSTSIVVREFGLVVPPRDAAALSQAIEVVVWINPAYRTAAADQGPTYIRENYSMDNAVALWGDLFSTAARLT